MQAVYAGRQTNRVVRALTLDREADELLMKFVGSRSKQLGLFLSRLLFEEAARREERERLRTLLDEGA